MCSSCLPTSTTTNGNILATPGQLPLQDSPSNYANCCSGRLQLSTASSSRLLRLMSSKGFSQLVKVPTTDSGCLRDHIYYSGTTTNVFIDVVDTYYSDHDATYISLPATALHILSVSFHSSTSTQRLLYTLNSQSHVIW